MAKSKGGKTPRNRENPTPTKQPVGAPADYNKERLAWRLEILDLDGPDFGTAYGWPALNLLSTRDLLKQVQYLETMTWSEVIANKKKNHSVKVKQLCSEARRRLVDLGQDDIEELFSIGNLGSTQRLWGIRDRNLFRVLWYDPDHRVCLSYKKNT